MKLRYQYPGPSVCVAGEGSTTLGLSPDLSRNEKISFRGRLRNPLAFRDAMLMLREIVVSDSRIHKKERTEYFAWLEEEIQRRMLQHKEYMPAVRGKLQEDMSAAQRELEEKETEIQRLIELRQKVGQDIDSHDAWRDYYRLEREFWRFIRLRDPSLWFVLDPVITVHPDTVSFEAFSLDESIYGCLSVDMEEFELLQEPALGTTNIDFSAKLAGEIARFRTYSNVELAVNPEGFGVASGAAPEYVEKKIDLPDSWIKGFNQVSAASGLPGVSLEISPADLYDICSFLRRHKAHESPRYMKWVLERDKPVRILFEPFGKELTLGAVYRGERDREERIWGRRRWLAAEKLLPLAKSFQIRLLGFGMPQFIVADLGGLKMTIGFSAWSANDWVKGTAFNIMSGYIGDGSYEEVYPLLRERRAMPLEEIHRQLGGNRAENTAGIGSLYRRGEGYYDAAHSLVRFRQLTNEPLPEALYETTHLERRTGAFLSQGMENFLMVCADGEYTFTNRYREEGEPDAHPSLTLDRDGQVTRLDCGCRPFRRGPRNFSAPCAHLLALYIAGAKFTKLDLEPGKEYRTNDIMELLL